MCHQKQAGYFINFVAMNAGQIREQLHAIIEVADEQRLSAIYTLLAGEAPKIDRYSPEALKKFYAREHQVSLGEMESFTVQESHDWIRSQRKGNDV